jgi:hypothetical protein
VTCILSTARNAPATAKSVPVRVRAADRVLHGVDHLFVGQGRRRHETGLFEQTGETQSLGRVTGSQHHSCDLGRRRGRGRVCHALDVANNQLGRAQSARGPRPQRVGARVDKVSDNRSGRGHGRRGLLELSRPSNRHMSRLNDVHHVPALGDHVVAHVHFLLQHLEQRARKRWLVRREKPRTAVKIWGSLHLLFWPLPTTRWHSLQPMLY